MTPASSANLMSSVVTEAAPTSVQAVFTSPKYSDLTVFCGRDKYLLHRAIVCPRSKFFDAACDGGFKVLGHIQLVDNFWAYVHSVR